MFCMMDEASAVDTQRVQWVLIIILLRSTVLQQHGIFY